MKIVVEQITNDSGVDAIGGHQIYHAEGIADCIATGKYRGFVMRTNFQLEDLYVAVLAHRALSNAISIVIMLACAFWLIWHPLEEYLLRWMRWHFWGYPA
jgi:hypothetical protein